MKPDESVASPPTGLESLFATLLIDAYEEGDVGTYDVPRAYLQAKLLPKGDNKRVLLRLVGNFVDLMCKVNPEHEKNVIYENGKKVLYLEILQAIYGCIELALRWYELYLTTLCKEGFVINLYDKCIANKMINGKQCTVVWYVDDNEISHEDPAVVTQIIELMGKHFGELAIKRGNKHRFLGMDMIVNKIKSIKIEMKEQLQETIVMFNLIDEHKISEVVTSPAQKHLMDVNEDADVLDKIKRKCSICSSKNCYG